MGLLPRAPLRGLGVRGIDAWPTPPGWTLLYQAVTDSTNDDARRAALSGCSDRSVFLAEEQRRGRGRLGRSWLAPAGSSLLFSIVLRRALDPVHLTAASAVSVAETVRLLTGLPARIKWPNDVMVRDRKVCGILTEVVHRAGGQTAVVGVGLNVNLDPATAGLPSTATSLSVECGRQVPRGELLEMILSRLDGYLGLEDAQLERTVYGRWNRLLWRRWQDVRVDQDQAVVRGVVEGLAPSGALRIRTSDGRRLEIVTGDVSAPSRLVVPRSVPALEGFSHADERARD